MNYANYKPVRFVPDCLFAAAGNVDNLLSAPSLEPWSAIPIAGDESGSSANVTFKELAEYFKKHYAKPAEYDVSGIKKAGMRAFKDTQNKLAILTEYFGSTKIRKIAYGDLDLFKAHRLQSPTIRKTSVRAIASVHRELELLRRLLTVAVQKRWLFRDPFQDGQALIKKAEETQRERIATREEEERLLAACDADYRRKHLRPFLICAFDTGFRAGEMYSLRICDVDFEDNCITAVSYKGKRRRERQFYMTMRLAVEMRKLCEGKKALGDHPKPAIRGHLKTGQ